MDSMLEVRNLNVFYGGFQALFNIEMDVGIKQIVSVLGANGAGKSTLLNTICGLLKPRSGKIIFKGNRIDYHESYDIVNLGLALVPEGRKIFSNLTVYENLLMGSYTPRARKRRKESLENVFDLFPHLKERRNQMGINLSGGEQQMLAIGRALMLRPSLIIFDEISLGLSPLVVKMLYETITKLNNDGMTIIIVEQDIKRSLKMSNIAYILQEGKVAIKGDPKNFTEEQVKKSYFGL